MDEKSSSIGVGGGGGASGRGPRRMCARTIACCCSAMSAWSDLRWSAMSSRAISCMRSSPMSAAERERGGEVGRWGGGEGRRRGWRPRWRGGGVEGWREARVGSEAIRGGARRYEARNKRLHVVHTMHIRGACDLPPSRASARTSIASAVPQPPPPLSSAWSGAPWAAT